MGGSELDLTASEFLVLRELFMNGQSSITDTVKRTGLAQSKVSSSVAKLRDRGWVATSRDPGDGRKTLVEVTEQVKVQRDQRRGRERQRPAGAIDPATGAGDVSRRARAADLRDPG